MADSKAQTPSQSVAGQGGQGASQNPQNLNQSPSPGGDGVQSSDSERRAHGLDAPVNQPAQQRVNAAERRERAEETKKGDKVGERASLIQSPGEVVPGEMAARAIDDAEARRKADDERAREAEFGEIPQATRDEMEAGKQALKRHARAPENPTNPVDDLNARKSA